MAKRESGNGARERGEAKPKSAKRNGWVTFLLFVVLLVGAGLLVYPTFANYYNSFRQSRAVASYVEYVSEMDDERYEEVWQNALDYNERMSESGEAANLTLEEKAAYSLELDITETGIMGTVEIPKIKVMLPVYHGTEESVLQYYVGHIDWSSLPVGSRYAEDDKDLLDPLFGSHSALSGHRGLPSARLFTDLDQLVEGDTFILSIMDRTLTYEVDQIRIVEPTELDDLAIEPGKDLCTLVTCTPYGINTHRLLVRGHRIPNEKKFDIRVSADAITIQPIYVAGVLAVPMLLLLLIWVIIAPGGKKRNK